MSYKYVPSGVMLLCDKGAGLGGLTATNSFGVTVNEEPIATDADLVPLLNVSPCGVCSVLQGPCVPAPVQWQDVKVDSVVGPPEWHPLLDCSTLTCAVGGNIRIMFTRADAEAAQAAQALHEVADVAKEVSFWTFVGGAVCAVAGVACCLTGVGAVAAPFLFAASAELFEVSAVTFEAGIALDVAALAVEPNLSNLGLVVVDALTLGAGKLLGKAVGKVADSALAKALAEQFRKAMAEAAAKAKEAAYEAAENIYKNTSKRKMPRAVTALYDRVTGQTYIGASRGVANASELESSVARRLPAESLEDWSTHNCAEVDALNKATANGANPENLTQHTVKIDKQTGEIVDYTRCKNCQITTHDITTPSDHPAVPARAPSFPRAYPTAPTVIVQPPDSTH